MMSFLLSAVMLAGILTPAAMAAPNDNTSSAESQDTPLESQDALPEEGFSFQSEQEIFPEDSGKASITVIRTGDLSEEAEVTLSAYDMNASYGKDYVLLDGEEPVKKIDGSRSVFEAFQEDGVLSDRQTIDQAILEGVAEIKETGMSAEELMQAYGIETGAEDKEEFSSLEVMERIGAKAASLTVRFEAEQDRAVVALEILDDDIPEYSESFFLGLSGDGVIPGRAVLSGVIHDNEEEAPTALVSFDEPEFNDEEETTVMVGLNRTGDLATMSTVLLSRDDAPYGYISFTPYQETQLVELPEGTYTLSDASGCDLGEITSTTVDAVPVDADEIFSDIVPVDPELDTIPVYSEVPDEISGMPESDIMLFGTTTGKPADWQKDWAKHGSYEDAKYIVFASTMKETDGRVSNCLFQKNDKNSSGKYQNFRHRAADNAFSLDTHGGESAMRSARVAANSIYGYSCTGMESYTLNYRIEGLNRNMKISSWSNGGESGERQIKGDKSSEELTVTYPKNKVDPNVSGGIFVQNIDPTNKDDGCELVIANAIRQNKREYLFYIKDSNTLTYKGEHNTNRTATINESDKKMVKTMWRDVNQDKNNLSRVPLRFSTSDGFVMKVTGYQLINEKTNKVSQTFSLNGANYILFTNKFLENDNREANYCYETQYNGKAYPTFTVRLIMEKESVKCSMEKSAQGDLRLTNGNINDFYKGETAVFEAKDNTEGTSLTGVYIRARTGSNYEWKTWTMHADSDHKVRVHMDEYYDEYIFQPVYSGSADILTVNYASDSARTRGQLVMKEGQAVSKNEYVKNDFVALAAQANDGYVTQWSSNGRVYYGDVFHYQLDGNPDNNVITVDFVKAEQSTADVDGALSLTETNLFMTSLSGSKPVANTEWSVISSAEYTGRTDSLGRYTIKDFRGVKGGIYSMLVLTGSVPSYRYFTFGDSNTYSERMPQFGPGIFYPDKVDVRLDNTGENSNLVQLRPESVVDVTVRVFNQEQSPYRISKVDLNLMGVNEKGQTYQADTLEAKLSATDASGGGNYSFYTARISAQNLPQDTRLFVNVTANMQTSGGTAEVKTGNVNSGYEFIAQINDVSLPIQEDVPVIPGATSALDVSLDTLDVPFVGLLDFSVGANNGAFFVRAADPNDPSIYTLTAGYSMIPTFGVTNPQDRVMQSLGNYQKLESMRAAGQKPLGDTSGVNSSIAADGSEMKATEAGQDKKMNARSSVTTPKLYIQPAVFLKFSMKTYVDKNGDTVTDLIGYDAVIGMDARLVVNITANVYGVPFFVCVTIADEIYVETQGKLGTGEGAIRAGADKTEIIYSDKRGDLTAWDVCLQIPMMNATIKGGIGFNNFASFYLQGKFNFKLGVMVGTGLTAGADPNKVGVNAGGTLSFALGGGVDLLVFSPNLTLNTPDLNFGNDKIRQSIFPVTSSKPGTLRADGIQVASLQEAMDRLPTEQDLMDALNDVTFTPVERNNPGMLLRSGPVSGNVLMENAFKGTKVKLTKLDGETIMATMLADNGAREGSYNFLSAAYAVSDDEGRTWNSVEPVSESESLQFDTNIFDLGDRLLVTWSEGDIDQVLEHKNAKELTAADMSAALNAMDLKGRFFDKSSGKPDGETFTIGANSGVACGMLDAIQSDNGNLYCYYERRQFPESDDVKLENLFQQDRTIACAIIRDGEVIDTQPVLAQNPARSENYRIMEVVPFSHKGMVGEALVIDLDGRLVKKTSSKQWSASDTQWTASNTDRQVFVRFYSPTDKPVTTALIPVTDPARCAQHVEVVSNGEELCMLWNQDGEVVYLNEFAVPSEATETEKEGALAIVDVETGEVTRQSHEESYGFGTAANHSTLHVDRAFDASISSDGNVLVSWAADKEPEDKAEINAGEYLAEEVFGVMLKKTEGEEDDAGLYHLEAVGKPVAITDENSAIGSVDGVCLSDDSFLLAYAKMDGVTRMDSKSAKVKAVRSVYESDLRIQSVEAPFYPQPGSEAFVTVTVGNYGLKPVDSVHFQVEGLNGGSVDSDETLMPGTSLTMDVPVSIPQDFNASAELNVTVSGADSNDTAQTEVLYGPYFVPDNMAKLDSIPGTGGYLANLTVRNIGNAPGKPEIKYSSYIPGMAEDSGKKEQVFRPEQEIEPLGAAVITSEITETPSANGQTIRVHVSLGDCYDQSVEGYAPSQELAPSVPENPTTPSRPNKPSSSGGAIHPTRPSDSESDASDNKPSDTVKPDAESESGNSDAAARFADVDTTQWYAEAVNFVVKKGLMNGTSSGFAPNAHLSRAMLAQILWNLAGKPNAPTSASFSDVSPNEWYTNAVDWAVSAGIVSGYSDGRFAPNDNITREQFASMLWRYSNKPASDHPLTFIDADDASSYALEALRWAVMNGILSGKGNQRLDPLGFATRAEAAQMLMNYISE